ncbi:MAG: YabP/YqfC family sporulation protein [Ruminiclostridium sp.]|jgi:YabP family.|nr:YabP/YqfC family sporulation protein [Ruminiclostridium sp.]
MNIYRLAGKFESIKRSAVRHSLIQINDNGRMTVEDCRKIIKFDENTIELELAKGTVTITGLDLKMKSFSDHGVIITGSLHSIGFDDSRKG